VRSEARGAVGGAVISGVAGDAGTGAAAGAVAGTMVGGARARQNQGAQNEYAQPQQQQALNILLPRLRKVAATLSSDAVEAALFFNVRYGANCDATTIDCFWPIVDVGVRPLATPNRRTKCSTTAVEFMKAAV
jgi:hypothetical protein